MLKNTLKHFILIIKHKWLVFKFACKLGIPIRGLLHDLSKFSPTEFFESVRYYNGKKSPILECKKVEGYSKAWLHHKGRNKHHYEYWIDPLAPNSTPYIPFKYVLEMICDKLAASKIYNGKNWTKTSQIEYWNKEKIQITMNKNLSNLLTDVFTKASEIGINKALNKKEIKKLYDKYKQVDEKDNIERMKLNENKV